MNINDWLKYFKKYWEEKNINGILSLFSDDVVYFETPFEKIKGKEYLEKEWETILSQHNINLNTEVFVVLLTSMQFHGNCFF